MMLAATEGSWGGLVVMAVFALIAWLSNRAKEKPGVPGAPRPGVPRRPSVGGPSTSEEERMRRFLEALGIPDGGASPPPPEARPQQAPRPMARPMSPAPVAPPPLVVVRPVLDEPPAPFRPTETFPVAEVVEVSAQDFVTVSSQATAIPTTPAAAAQRARLETPPALKPTVALHLKQRLSSPTEVRTAFLLREVLGPPPGLQ